MKVTSNIGALVAISSLSWVRNELSAALAVQGMPKSLNRSVVAGRRCACQCGDKKWSAPNASSSSQRPRKPARCQLRRPCPLRFLGHVGRQQLTPPPASCCDFVLRETPLFFPVLFGDVVLVGLGCTQVDNFGASISLQRKKGGGGGMRGEK